MGLLPQESKHDLAYWVGQINRCVPLAAEKMQEIYGLETEEDAAKMDCDLMSDGMLYGYQLWARAQDQAGKTAPYVYCFDHPLPDENGNPSPEGAFHSSELWYMHGTLDRCWRKMGEEDRRISDEMMAAWTNFAKTGNPNGKGAPVWEPYTCSNPQIMVFGTPTGMQKLEDHPAVKVFAK